MSSTIPFGMAGVDEAGGGQIVLHTLYILPIHITKRDNVKTGKAPD